jgi:hypothetical protein
MDVSEKLFSKWNKWLSTIYDDIQGLLVNRHIFREVQEIIRSNTDIQFDDTFYEWMGNVYAAAAVIGVRRQVDTHKGSISFARLLGEIRENPEILPRERYLRLYKDRVIRDRVANRTFDKFAGTGRQHVNGALVGADLNMLNEKAETIRKFANKRIAHTDRAEFKSLPTYGELDDCLDYLEEMLKKYLSLFRAETHRSIVPVWTYDWKEIFRRPWIV